MDREIDPMNHHWSESHGFITDTVDGDAIDTFPLDLPGEITDLGPTVDGGAKIGWMGLHMQISTHHEELQ